MAVGVSLCPPRLWMPASYRKVSVPSECLALTASRPGWHGGCRARRPAAIFPGCHRCGPWGVGGRAPKSASGSPPGAVSSTLCPSRPWLCTTLFAVREMRLGKVRRVSPAVSLKGAGICRRGQHGPLRGRSDMGWGLCSRRCCSVPVLCVTQEAAITPSDETLFPGTDWLIGNHSDELTPWIPVIAAR